jgi:hypothetical protein
MPGTAKIVCCAADPDPAAWHRRTVRKFLCDIEKIKGDPQGSGDLWLRNLLHVGNSRELDDEPATEED